MKKFLLVSLALIVAGCANFSQRRGTVETVPPSSTSKSGIEGQPETSLTPPSPTDMSGEAPPLAPAEPTPQAPAKNLPRIGLILGPGAIRSYAHVGVLQELAKSRIKIHSIAGIEMGSLFAAIYAKKEQAYDVEWQSFKLNDEDLVTSNLLNQNNNELSLSGLNGFFNEAFKSLKAEDASIPFVCPSINIQKHQVYLLSRGGFDQLLPYCMAFPPLWKPVGSSYAYPYEINKISDYLRQKGANYIVYVNVMPVKNDLELNGMEFHVQMLWETIHQSPQKKWGVDQIVQVDTSNFGWVDTKKRRQLVGKGAEAGRNAASIIVKKFGL